MEHIHISKVLDWGFDENYDFKAVKWGCALCDETQDKPFESEEIEFNHIDCGDDCFGCKVKTLELNTGDANSKKTMSNKKFNSELNAYKEARRQGIQPSGTTMTKIEQAYKASENLGKAYKGESMPDASKIDKSLAKTINELGA
jgi:hypothetical protein